MGVILESRNIVKEYVREGFLGAESGKVKALRGINFRINRGDILGMVGESGSGKSTLAKIICSLEKPTSGRLVWNVDSRIKISHPAQMVFQNPFNSLNPKLTVGYMIKEAISCGNGIRFSKVDGLQVEEVLRTVGMKGINTSKYPHQFSGGQRQRLVIARALALKPDVLVCDEPVSALDISVQAQIVNLLIDINKSMDLTIIFIAHDIEVVSMIAHNVMVMKNGKVVEYGAITKVIRSPQSEYTGLLLDAVPRNPWV